MNLQIKLTSEQQNFIDTALEGKNILVDACIGSGKTTAINYLCNVLPRNKKILYLTYNRLLKHDAKDKILAKNVKVQNYHGFAYGYLKKNDIPSGVSDSIQIFLDNFERIKAYDVLIIDEYQDVNEEISKLLEVIKLSNPSIQIIVVGDMEQKIYNTSNLDVVKFFNNFLDDYVQLKFTTCFRLSDKYAQKLAYAWKKEIHGVNNDLDVKMMNLNEIVGFLSNKNPSDILCLGSKSPDGNLFKTLNMLERYYSDIFNKNTVYATITEDNRGAVKPDSNSAIFTTFDGCKGLERNIVVIFDFTEFNWDLRIKKPQSSYVILRNIFLVAASRGKKKIIFVNDGNSPLLSFDTLARPIENKVMFESVNISNMFDFKFKEDIEKCFKELKITEVDLNDKEVIDIKDTDGLIDLTPCIGIYQEKTFFKNSSVQKDLDLHYELNKSKSSKINVSGYSLPKQVLTLTSVMLGQNRYQDQVSEQFVSSIDDEKIKNRLATKFTSDEEVQVRCQIDFLKSDGVKAFSAIGLADVLKNNIVYELKFVQDLTHEHFLQCACYILGLNLKLGALWNTRTNKFYFIEVPNRKSFLDKVTIAVTKGQISQFYAEPSSTSEDETYKKSKNKKRDKKTVSYEIVKEDDLKVENEKIIVIDNKPLNDFNNVAVIDYNQNSNLEEQKDKIVGNNISIKAEMVDHKVEKNYRNFAVIDCETNYNDEVMSIGVVVSNEQDMKPLLSKYFIITPEYEMPAMYRDQLYNCTKKEFVCCRSFAVSETRNLLKKNNVTKILAYNGSFDKSHLKELNMFTWCDIMKLAYSNKYNKKIPADVELYKTGKMKSGYKVDDMYRMLTGDTGYCETHNAYQDAIDELTIVRELGLNLDVYDDVIIDNTIIVKEVPRSSEVIAKTNESKVVTREANSTKSNHPVVKNYNEVKDEITVPVTYISQALGTTSGIYRDIHNGYLKAEKIKGRYEVTVDEANRYIEKRQRQEEIDMNFVTILTILMLVMCIIALFVTLTL